MDALATTNTVVGYIDPGLIVTGQTNARGLCFWDGCLSPTAIGKWTSDGVPYQVTSPVGPMQFLDNGFAPKAKVVFLAACGIDQSFLNQWHLQPGQALIVPQYLVPSENLEIDTLKAALEWEEILVALAAGSNVSAAVAKGNQAAADNHVAHRWQVFPENAGNVTIR